MNDDNTSTGNGTPYILADETNTNQPSAQQLARMVKQGTLIRVRHGIYAQPDTIEDEMYLIQCRSSVAIFSHETALFQHGLSDRQPFTFSVSVPQGSNMKFLRDENIRVFYVKPEMHSLGITEGVTMFGNPIRLYDPERAICDVFRSRKKMDDDIAIEAILRYMKQKDRDLVKLLQYARKMRIEKSIRPYLEVLA